MKRKLSVCIITKNEAEKLERCLQAIAGYGFEIVVVDTGSTDHTCEMVKNYTDKLYHMDWQDDFALAKNTAIGYATNEMVLVLDSDEYMQPLTKEELERLRQMIETDPERIGRIYRINELDHGGEKQENYEWINRIFSKEKYCYRGCIHEQLVRKGDTGPVCDEILPTYLSPVRIRHDGYLGTPAQKQEKALRNIALLEKELAKKEDPYVLYQLGKSYYLFGDFTKAAVYFDQALYFDLNPKLEYVIDLIETYGYALLNSDQEKKALGLEGVYPEFGNSADFQFLMGLIYMKNARFDDAVAEFQKAAGHDAARMQGVNSYLAWYNIGVIYECLGYVREAIRYYRRADGYEKARKRLEELT